MLILTSAFTLNFKFNYGLSLFFGSTNNQTQTNERINECTTLSYGVNKPRTQLFLFSTQKLNKWLKDPKQQVYVEYTNPIRDYVKHTDMDQKLRVL